MGNSHFINQILISENHRILTAHLSNQFPNLLRDARPPRSAVADLPGPEQTKGCTVPGDDGLRFEDDERRAPGRPHVRQARPEESIKRGQFGALHRALQNAELMTESEDLDLER